MLRYGCTRLEIGVQSVCEDVARDTNRGHTVRSVFESFHLAKDAGFKVVAHMMPDLPNVGVERDLEQFKEYFENPAFRSDGLKIYPTLVIPGTGLYDERDDIKIIRRTFWLTWLLGYLPLFLLGRGCTGYRGNDIFCWKAPRTDFDANA